MKEPKIDVSIVIVAMNHLSKLKNLLESIVDMGKTNFTYEVVLVDNCSKDGTIEYVTQNYPNIKLSINDKIEGFAYNTNYGVSMSKGEYIFICNPDMILLKGSLDKLLAYAIENPKSGIVSPQLLNSDYTYQPSIRKFHSIKLLFWRIMSGASDQSKNKTVTDYLLLDFDKTIVQPIDWAIGAAMLISRDLYINKLSGFDEKFFLYVEDQDICLRAWKLGYEVTYNPASVMIHDHQRSSVKKINKLTWFHFKSLVYFIFKHNLFIKPVVRTDYTQNSNWGEYSQASLS